MTDRLELHQHTTSSVMVEEPGEIFGRSPELARIQQFLGDLQRDGKARLISGEAGIGKSALLNTAGNAAERMGIRVLRTIGSEFEADVSYSSLNQLLLNVGSERDELPSGLQSALNVALGLSVGAAPDRLIVCNATLALLKSLASERPLLLLVDDLHWVDPASALVLSFIARRVTGVRIGVVGAYRLGAETFFERGGIETFLISPLDEGDARDLLEHHFPSLSPSVRQRIIDDAQGNPLALLELPWSLSGPQRAMKRSFPELLPLTDRLAALFSSRIASLPDASFDMLLSAVCEGRGASE